MEPVFTTDNEVIDFLYCSVLENGDPGLAGIEEEILLLDKNGGLLSIADYSDFLICLAKLLPGGEIRRHELNSSDEKCLLGISCDLGLVQPETNTSIIEFAHKPQYNSWKIHDQSKKFSEKLLVAANKYEYLIAGLGVVPSIAWEDFVRKNAVMPHPTFDYSQEHMRNGTRVEYCRTVFGTASIHHNHGFNNPDKLAKFFKTALMLQPTMIAINGNSPYWNGKRALSVDGKKLLSLRGYYQAFYGEMYGVDGLKYLYPDQFFVDGFDFEKLINCFLDFPLDRTIVGGNKFYVGGTTMRNYVNKGYSINNVVNYPSVKSLEMMFKNPMMDVKASLVNGPRVETRAHDTVSSALSISLDAFYRGLAVNVDEIYKVLIKIQPEELRSQRLLVCYGGLDSKINCQIHGVKNHRDLANVAIDIAEDGLSKRGLGEAQLLQSLKEIVSCGINNADRIVSVFGDELFGRELYFNVGYSS